MPANPRSARVASRRQGVVPVAPGADVVRAAAAAVVVFAAAVAGVVLTAAAAVTTPAAGAVASQVPFGLVPRARVEQLGPGKLLVAARELREPNFAQSLVLLVDHGPDGAMGLVVNERTTVTLSRIFPGLMAAAGPRAVAFLGGPVTPGGALALARSPADVEGARRVIDEVYLIQTRLLMEEWVSREPETTRFRVFLGYAGWAPGQLERETELGAWLVMDASADVIFDPDPDTIWGRQIARTEWRRAAR